MEGFIGLRGAFVPYDDESEGEKGFTNQEIKKIKKDAFEKENLPCPPNQTTEICIVCWSEYEEGEKIRNLSCNHMFHSKCIRGWLEMDKKCPVCKQVVHIPS